MTSPEKATARRKIETFNRRIRQKNQQRRDESNRCEAAKAPLSRSFTEDQDLHAAAEEGRQICDTHIETQTDLTMSDVTGLQSECQSLRSQCEAQRVLINYLSINETTFIDNDDTVKLYIGLPAYDILIGTHRFVLLKI